MRALGRWILLVVVVVGAVSATTPPAKACSVLMQPIPDQNVGSGSTFGYFTKVNIPPDRICDYDMSFSLAQAPSGMTIDPAGSIHWLAPAVAAPSQTFQVTVVLTVQYWEPAQYVRNQYVTFNITIWNCDSVDLSVRGQWYMFADYSTTPPTKQEVWVQVAVTNPSPVCTVQNVNGEVDQADIISGLTFLHIGTYSTSIGPSSTKVVWTGVIVAQAIDSRAFDMFVKESPPAKWRVMINGASASDANVVNNKCMMSFSYKNPTNPALNNGGCVG